MEHSQHSTSAILLLSCCREIISLETTTSLGSNVPGDILQGLSYKHHPSAPLKCD